jgi:threonine aldolase
LNSIAPARLCASVPVTNIVMLDLAATGHDAGTWVHELGEAGVKVRAWGAQRLRLVTHRHIDATGLDAAIAAFRTAAQKLLA